jgi:hypothetical protein
MPRVAMPVNRTAWALYAAAVAVASFATTLWYATARGQDFNWDQRNYHIGIPFLLEHGTFWKSIAPASVQSYTNPYVLEVQFFLLRHLSAIGFVATLAAWQSAAFMIAGIISADIARPAGGLRAIVLALLGFALALLAPMPLSVAGTTFIDLTTAVPVLAAYALLLRRGRWRSPLAAAALAGAFLGASTALKLTNGVFALGAVGFALAGPERLRARIGCLVASGAAAALVFVAVNGLWGVRLWERFGNPVFPYYNNIFHSPDYPPFALRDVRFLPHSILAIWRYPLYSLFGGSPVPGVASPSAELLFKDPRWIVAVGGITLFLVALLSFPRWARERLKDPVTGLLFAFALSYLIWLFEFGIQRYAAPLDVLCGTVLLALAMPLPTNSLRLCLLSVMVVVSWRLMVVPDWGHVPWRAYWRSINPTPLGIPQPALVFLTDKPSLFIAASLPPDTRYVGADGWLNLQAGNDTALTRQLKQELAAGPPLHLLEADPGAVPASAAAILASYGLVATDHCRQLRIADEAFRICDVARRSQ